jgi:hypothetical protein
MSEPSPPISSFFLDKTGAYAMIILRKVVSLDGIPLSSLIQDTELHEGGGREETKKLVN